MTRTSPPFPDPTRPSSPHPDSPHPDSLHPDSLHPDSLHPDRTIGSSVPGSTPQTSRWNQGAWLFRDQTLQKLEILLDEAVRIPGIGVRFGLDGIIGLVPGIGDVLAGLLSLVIPIAAWIRGVPYVTLVRMMINVGIGVLVGSVPVLGDVFDILWKANHRNYRLLQRHLLEPRSHHWRDWAFLLILLAVLGIVFTLPLLVLVWLIAWLVHR